VFQGEEGEERVNLPSSIQMAALSPSPSPFATLLRRSKFASYDPRIAQVFTTYDGSAHRGDWGLKRPLALRRRGAYITVKSVDTSSQQTEWNSGEKQAQFMRRYEELNIEPRRYDTRQHFDSEFAPGEVPGEAGVEPPQLTRNPVKMTPGQFRKYLEQLRAKRPAFIQYLQKQGLTETVSLFELAQQPDTSYHARFLADETTEARNSLTSRIMDRSMHKNGGLIYSRPSQLQTYLTTKPQPGRVLQDAVAYHPKQRDALIVAFAGMTPTLWKRHIVGEVKKIRWSEKPSLAGGVANFRMTSPRLQAMPRVVGKRQGLKAVKLRMDVRNVPQGPGFERSNTHLPGSVDYVAAANAPTGLKGGKPAAPVDFKEHILTQFLPDLGVQGTLQRLKEIVGNDRIKKK
jgi:hypothetical protein